MHPAGVWQHNSNSNIKIAHNSIEYCLWNPSDFFPDDVLSCLWIVFTNSAFQVLPGALEHNRTLEYLRHNFPWDRLISHQTNNHWPSYSQDLNPPAYFLREYLKDSVCESKPQTREGIIRKEIRRIPQAMLNRIVDNFTVRVAAVLSYNSAVHGTIKVLITEKV